MPMDWPKREPEAQRERDEEPQEVYDNHDSELMPEKVTNSAQEEVQGVEGSLTGAENPAYITSDG